MEQAGTCDGKASMTQEQMHPPKIEKVAQKSDLLYPALPV
jgi:hypothetical protein